MDFNTTITIFNCFRRLRLRPLIRVMGVSVVALTGAGVALALERGGNLVLAGSLSCSSCTSTCSSACSWACSWSAVLPRNLQKLFVSISQTLITNNQIGLHFPLLNQFSRVNKFEKHLLKIYKPNWLVWLAKSSASVSCKCIFDFSNQKR